MMFGTMKEANLYPPLYLTRPRLERDAVIVLLRNQNRPSIWQQVTDYLEKHGTIGNAQVRQLLSTDDTLRASKQLKHWVEQGVLLVVNPDAGTNVRRYTTPDIASDEQFFSLMGRKEG